MYAKNHHNRWILFLFLLAGMVIGAFLCALLGKYPVFAWLNFGRVFGLTQPIVLSLGILSMTLGFTIDINIGGIIGMILGGVVYRLSWRLQR